MTWIQSAVPDERVRTILFDLSGALKRAETLGDSQLAIDLNKSYHNLLRYAIVI